MPRRKTIRNSIYSYHCVARTHNKVWWPIEKKTLWNIFIEELKNVQDQFFVKIYAFVLMDNHFHLMLRTPQSNIDEVMFYIMKNSALRVMKIANLTNSIYGQRYKGSLLKKNEYELNVIKYILRNPIAVNLCQKAQDYPYSTFHYTFYKKETPIEISEVAFLDDYYRHDREGFIDWINIGHKDHDVESIKKGLIRPEFKYGIDPRTKRENKVKIIHPKITTIEQMWEEFMPEKDKSFNPNQTTMF